jgi:diguanylate cyclase (GGDEF)-like protein/PAS domain S-box-containing protein
VTDDALTGTLLAAGNGAAELLVGADGRVAYVSPSAAQLIGHTAASLTGAAVFDLVHPDDLARTYQLNEDDILLTGTTTGAWRIRHRDGGWRMVEAEVSSTQDLWEPHDLPRTEVPGLGMRSFPAMRVLVRPIVDDRSETMGRPTGSKTSDGHSQDVWELDILTGSLRILGDPADGGDTEQELASLQAVVHPDDRAFTPLALLATLANDVDVFTSEHRVIDDRQVRWYQHRVRVFRDRSGQATHLRATTADITEERRAVQEREDTLIRYRRTVEAAGDAYLEVDRTGVVIGWSDRAEELFGWTAAEATGRCVDSLLRPGGPTGQQDEPLSTHLVANRHPGRRPTPRELQVIGGHPWPLDLELITTTVDLPSGMVHTALFRDISQRRTSEAELARLALSDGLTGLPNRGTAMGQLEAILTTLPGRGRDGEGGGLIGVLSIDLDRFKVMNDSIGRRSGDRLLRQLAARLHQVVDETDIIARVGGDEFMIIATGSGTVAEVEDLARAVAASLSEPVWMNGRDLRPTASIGVALTHRAVSAETLVRDADTAMHQAKARGGHRVEVFTPVMRRNVLTHFQLEQELRAALDRRALRVEYQPIVGMDGTVTGAEALVRWPHPTRGMLQPADFIPLAEKTGLIIDLGREVLRTACRHTATWRRNLSADFRVSVNVAAAQLDDPAFAELVERTLADAGLDPGGLCLEITETALMVDTTTARSSLQRLGHMGCAVALDDFGTGYSPLLNLRYFPVDVIKLDRYFVAGLERDRKNQAIIGAVIDLAHALGMTTVAEGVDTGNQRDILQLLGCDNAQGYLWHRPLPPEAIDRLLSDPTRLPVRSGDPAGPGPGRVVSELLEEHAHRA